MKFIEKNRSKLIILVIAIILVLVSTSYAYWQITKTQRDENLLSIGCFDFSFVESNAITLDKAYPMIDSDGKKLTPYTFTIKNECSITGKVQINLEINDDTTFLDSQIKMNITNPQKVKYNVTAKLNELTRTEKTLGDDYDRSYLMKESIIPEGGSITYELRLWIDESVETEGFNKDFLGKVTITITPTLEMNCDYPGNLGEGMCGTLITGTSGVATTAYLNGPLIKNTIESIEFMNHKNVPEDAIGRWDVSEDQDGSVIAWYKDVDSNDKYEVYIGSNIGVIANTNSSNLFSYLTEIANLELNYLDTKDVKDMSRMFYYTGRNNSNFTLDVSSFDTSQVTTMQAMFLGTGYNSTIFSLDLSNFDTKHVTNMYQMFAATGYNSQTFTLNIINFNTSQVTNMGNMFSETGYSSTTFTLDISNFDTSKATIMAGMFSGTGYNNSTFTLDLSSFNTSQVTSMSTMFRNTGYKSTLLTLDLSNFDTSKVQQFEYMFQNTGFSNAKFALDISNFNFSSAYLYENIFSGLQENCPIKVKNQATKDYILSLFRSDLTGIYF